jgi:outer membrane protein assembly factor BamB
MRYSLIILALLLLLTGCTQQKLYTSKGVTYFEKPAAELNGIWKLNLQSTPEKAGLMVIPGLPVVNNDIAYYPMQTTFGADKTSKSSSTVYAFDLKTMTLKDSLMINPKSSDVSFRHLVVLMDVYMAGVKDTLLNIIKTDINLKNMMVYPTNIKIHFVAYAGNYAELLRIVVVDFNQDVILYDFDTATMQPVRKRLLLKNYMNNTKDGENLWFFSAAESRFEAVKINLSVFDPAPVFKSFDYAIKDFTGARNFVSRVHGDVVYLSYVDKMDETGSFCKLIALNFNDGTMQSADYTGSSAFDLVDLNGKTYFYNATSIGKKNALVIREIGPDLKLGTSKLAFSMADSHIAGRILAFHDKQFILTGNNYQLPKGKKVDSATMTFQPFLAVTGAE